jgi:hypothetical protein
MDPQLSRFDSVTEYNTAHSDYPIPEDPQQRQAMRCYHAAMAGIEDDLCDTGASLTVEFLPCATAKSGTSDPQGAVVATHWGRAPILVLAESVPLLSARKAITKHWPTRLSEVRTALSTLPTGTASDG